MESLKSRSWHFLFGLLLLALIPWGCSPASSRLRHQAEEMTLELYSASAGPRILDRNHVDLEEIQELDLKAEWIHQFRGHVHVDVSPRGSCIVSTQSGRTGGVRLYGSDGILHWNRSFPSYQKTQAWFVGGQGHVAVWAHRACTNGIVVLYSPEGEELFRRGVKGAISITMAPGAERLSLLQHGEHSLEIMNLAGKVLSRLRVSQGASVIPVPEGGGFLVLDEQALVLVGRDGRRLRQQDLPRDLLRGVAISPDGTRLAVTTGQGDNSLVLLDEEGQPLWSTLLVPGGTNDLVFSPRGHLVLAYNVGRRGGLYLFSSTGGRLRWRTALDLDPADNGVAWRHMSFSEDGTYLSGILVTRDYTGGSVSERYQLVIISIDGEFLARTPLGTNLDVSISSDGGLLVTAGTAPGSSVVMESVRFFDLGQLGLLVGAGAYR